MKIIEKIEDKISHSTMSVQEIQESKGMDLIVDLCILMMNLADVNCSDDPIVPFKNLSQIILAKYSAYNENVATSFVKLALFWFR